MDAAAAVVEHYPTIRRATRRATRDDPEDIAQEVAVRLLARPPAYCSAAYLTLAVRGRLVSRWRHEHRTDWGGRQTTRCALSPLLPLAARDDTEREGIARQELAATLARLHGEPHGWQLVAFALGWAGEDIAAIYGIPTATLRTRVFDMRRRLGTWREERDSAGLSSPGSGIISPSEYGKPGGAAHAPGATSGMEVPRCAPSVPQEPNRRSAQSAES
jgi:DNA-directed RNA polymerase specialized sigma24 family protein